MENARPSSLRSLLFQGIRVNAKPGLVLWLFALGLVLLYFFLPAARPAYDSIGALKTRFGFLYSLVATMFFGGLLPFVILFLSGRIPKGKALPQLLFFLIFWGVKGVEVDLLYRFQTLLFGSAPEFWTILRKTLFDQFVYNPLWGLWFMVFFYLWKDLDFSFARLRGEVRKPGFFRNKVLPVYVTSLAIWLPTVSIIYALPASLQVPLFNIVLCFWCLILNFLSSKKEETGPAAKNVADK